MSAANKKRKVLRSEEIIETNKVELEQTQEELRKIKTKLTFYESCLMSILDLYKSDLFYKSSDHFYQPHIPGQFLRRDTLEHTAINAVPNLIIAQEKAQNEIYSEALKPVLIKMSMKYSEEALQSESTRIEDGRQQLKEFKKQNGIECSDSD